MEELHQDAARPHQDQGTERGVAHDAERDLHARRRHLLHRHQVAEGLGEVPVHLSQRLEVPDVQADPAHVRLVRDPRHRRLHRDRIADPARRPLGLLEGLRVARLRGRDPVAGEQFERHRLRELATGEVLEHGPPFHPELVGPGRERLRRGSLMGRRIVQQVLQRVQPRHRPLEHRDAGAAEPSHLLRRDRRGQVRDDAERLRRRVEHVLRDLEVPLVVGLPLPREIHREGDRGRLGIVVERPEALEVDPIGIDPGPPRVERVLGDEPRVEHRVDPLPRGVGDLRERHAEVRREIDEQGALSPGVVERRDPRAARDAT